MSRPELLAPAGNLECLHAAVTAGADAVYLGLDEFNARRNAGNFTLESLPGACDYAHLRGVAVYVTMNVEILPSELVRAVDVASRAWKAGADAFIVQDIGLARELGRTVPQAPIHASTQMNVHNMAGIAAAARLGASRVTLARELSLPEIAELSALAADFGMEVECFAHGALCVCYSGQCLMSSMIGGRSANRGLCAQACRLPYELRRQDLGEPLPAEGEHLLSPRDLCTIDILDDLVAAGVASLKIEGRMKSPDYVHAVVSVYREVLDRAASSADDSAGAAHRHEGASQGAPDVILSGAPAGREVEGSRALPAQPGKVTPAQKARLAEAFSRGFTTAYLEGQRGNGIMSYGRPNNRGVFAGRVARAADGEAHVVPEVDLHDGDVLEFWTNRGHFSAMVADATLAQDGTVRVAVDQRTGKGDRVFRVRNAALAFEDDPLSPRIPVIGRVTLRIGHPARIEFVPVGKERNPASRESYECALPRAGELELAPTGVDSPRTTNRPDSMGASAGEKRNPASRESYGCALPRAGAEVCAPTDPTSSPVPGSYDGSRDPASAGLPGGLVGAQTSAPAAEGGNPEERSDTFSLGAASGPIVEPARTRAITSEDVRAHVDRLGNTPFILESLEIDLDENVGISFSQLHHLRSDALENLQVELLSSYKKEYGSDAGERGAATGFSEAATHEGGASFTPLEKEYGSGAGELAGELSEAATSEGGAVSEDCLSERSERVLDRTSGKRASGSFSVRSGRLQPAPVHTSSYSPPRRNEERLASASSAADSRNPEPRVVALATNPTCARAARRAGADGIYVPLLNFRRGQAQLAGVRQDDPEQAGYPKQCVMVLPTVDHDPTGCARETTTPFDPWDYVREGKPVLAANLGDVLRAVEAGARVEVGPHVPATNTATLQALADLGVSRVWLSPELTLGQIADLARETPVPLGLTVAGAQELMITEHCLLMSQGPCNEQCETCPRRSRAHFLRDRKGYDFPVVTDMLGRSHLYNGIELDAVPTLPDLVDIGISAVMVDTTLMSKKEAESAVARAVRARDLAHQEHRSVQKRQGTTTGHLHRGVS